MLILGQDSNFQRKNYSACFKTNQDWFKHKTVEKKRQDYKYLGKI